MSRKANPVLIGVFVTGAVVLLTSVIVFLGSGMLFAETERYVIYFSGSVKGLRVGAPVSFRGVNIGLVKDIKVIFNPEDYDFKTPVIVDINTEQVSISGKSSWIPGGGMADFITELIEKGLRAQLELQSLVTGQLQINLDFHVDTSANFVEDVTNYQQIPSIPSSIEELSQTLQNIPIKELMEDFRGALSGIKEVVSSGRIEAVFDELNLSLKKAGKFLDELDTKVTPLSEEWQQAARNLSNMIKAAEESLDDLRGMQDGSENLKIKAHELMEELEEASRSIKNLAEFLRRNPEALVHGQKRR